jgi:hypothetical protein
MLIRIRLMVKLSQQIAFTGTCRYWHTLIGNLTHGDMCGKEIRAVNGERFFVDDRADTIWLPANKL